MQSVKSRIWTRITVSISCDDNHYTTEMFLKKMKLELTSFLQVFVQSAEAVEYTDYTSAEW